MAGKQELPILTIAMPIWNRQYCINEVLNSICSQTYPKQRIKIVFVDNCSVDGTTETIKAFQAKKGNEYANIQVIVRKSNLPEARNICVRNSVGDLLVFWDSDVVAPDNDALARLVNLTLEKDVVATVYPCYTKGNQTLYARIAKTRVKEGIAQIDGLGFSITVLRRDIFDLVGLFNEKSELSEEEEFYLRVKNAGLKVLCDNRTPCVHLKLELEGAGWSRYMNYLKRCFRGSKIEYDQFLISGNMIYYMRLIIYFMIPPMLALLVFGYWIILVICLCTLLLYQLYKSNGAWFIGVTAFLYHLLPGIIISYGYLYHKIKLLLGVS